MTSLPAIRDPARDPLARLAEARQALEQSRDLAEVHHIHDLAVAAKEYARARKLGTEAVAYAQEIVNRAERRIGQLLAGEPRAVPKPYTRAEDTARYRAGYKVSARSQLLAAMPDAAFEANVRRPVTAIAAIARAHRAGQLRGRPPLADLASMGPFPVLYADPPWRYEHARPGREVESHYPTMPLEEIKALRIPAAASSAVFLWATPPKLMEAGEVLAAWRFTYKTCLVWVKDRVGMGYYARQRHELLLIGKRGNFPAPLAPWPDSIIEEPRGEHSAKPAVFYDLIEKLYPGLAYCELFARQARPGWHAWGNEAEADPWMTQRRASA